MHAATDGQTACMSCAHPSVHRGDYMRKHKVAWSLATLENAHASRALVSCKSTREPNKAKLLYAWAADGAIEAFIRHVIRPGP